MACFISLSVFNITPSAASTNITTPSQILRAAVTSSEKFTCPKQTNKYLRKFKIYNKI